MNEMLYRILNWLISLTDEFVSHVIVADEEECFWWANMVIPKYHGVLTIGL